MKLEFDIAALFLSRLLLILSVGFQLPLGDDGTLASMELNLNRKK
jgi:hypothetical protein